MGKWVNMRQGVDSDHKTSYIRLLALLEVLCDDSARIMSGTAFGIAGGGTPVFTDRCRGSRQSAWSVSKNANPDVGLGQRHDRERIPGDRATISRWSPRELDSRFFASYNVKQSAFSNDGYPQGCWVSYCRRQLNQSSTRCGTL